MRVISSLSCGRSIFVAVYFVLVLIHLYFSVLNGLYFYEESLYIPILFIFSVILCIGGDNPDEISTSFG